MQNESVEIWENINNRVVVERRKMQGKINNLEIRQEIERKRLCYTDVAKELGVHRCTLSMWLHDELPDDKKQMILSAIAKIE